MYVIKCSSDGIFTNGELNKFGPIELNPSAGVLNYGQVCCFNLSSTYIFQNVTWGSCNISYAVLQGLFEGLKAYRKADGSILLFRPEENAMRMIDGAARMCMPAPTVEQFVDAVKMTVLANNRWVPDLCFHSY